MPTITENFNADAKQMTYPSLFVIEHEAVQRNDPDAYSIALRDWCLPIGGFTQESEQRVKTTWYPGATRASSQVFGPKYPPTIVTGAFRTRYMDGEAFVQRFGDGRKVVIHTAEDAKAIFEDLVLVGRLVGVQWSDFTDTGTEGIRWGFVQRVKFNVVRAQFIEWELSLEWVAKNNDVPMLATVTQPEDGKKLLSLATALKDGMDTYSRIYRRAVNTLNSSILAVSDYVNNGIAMTREPAQSAQAVAIVAGNVLQAIADAGTQAAETQSCYSRAASQFNALSANAGLFAAAVNIDPVTAGDSPPADDAATQIALAFAMMEVQALAMRVKEEAEAVRANALAQSAPDLLDLYTVIDGDTLRKISTRYSGTHDNWDDVADYNGLRYDALTAGMVLRIPRLG